MKKAISVGIPRVPFMILLGLLLTSSTQIILAQSDAQIADRVAAERLTNELISLNSQYQAVGATHKAELLSKVQAAAAKRQEFLNSIVDYNPAEVLRVAIPSTISSSLPPSLRNVVEQEVDLEGELEVVIEDNPTSSKLHHFLHTGKERVELHFAGEAPTDLLTGSIVRAHGVRLPSGLALSSGSSANSGAIQTVFAPLPNTFGAQKTLVILVNFQDNTAQPWTVATAQNMTFTTGSNFWLENSLQQTWLTGDVAGWYTLPINSAGTTCDTTFLTAIQNDAQQAAQNAGYVLSSYSHFVYAFPQTAGCNWLGWSYIGGIPSSSWINGNFILQVIDHELGHALGLYHSHGLNCGNTQYAGSGCTQYEYGDYYDIMGNSYPMHYNAFQKERLGWLNNGAQPPITSVTASGTYQISPYEIQDGTPKALKILQSGSTSTYYYIESRQAIGFDNLLSIPEPYFKNVLAGILFHVAIAGNANSSNLLDMNPSDGWGNAMALDAGQSYTDAAAGITISPSAVSVNGATVQVTINAAPCTHSNPTVSISPSQSQWVTAGTSVTFTGTVTNNDNSSCSNAVFNLTANVPSGWAFSLGSSSLTLAPGGSGTTTFQVTSPAGAANGFYNVSLSADNSSATGYSGSASATYVIGPLSIAVSTNQASYTRSQTAMITATMVAGGSPYAGAAVKFSITKSNGNVVSLSGTTGSKGTATVSYRFKKTDPVGTYTVTASSNTGGAAVTATTSFNVQ